VETIRVKPQTSLPIANCQLPIESNRIWGSDLKLAIGNRQLAMTSWLGFFDE
jgi:hypothetical protein